VLHVVLRTRVSGLASKHAEATGSHVGPVDSGRTSAEETSSVQAMFLPRHAGIGQAGNTVVPSGIVGPGLQLRPSGGGQTGNTPVPSGIVGQGLQLRPSGKGETSHASVASGIVGWGRGGGESSASEITEVVAEEASPPKDLASIRRGRPGEIRSAAELSSEDVAHAMNAQLQGMQPNDIQAIIASFPPAEQAHARIVLSRSSGFGRMESLNPLREALEPHLAKGGVLFTPGKGSLADNIAYTSLKGLFPAYPGRITTSSVKKVRPGTVMILDDVVLSMIMSDPVFARSLREQRAVLLEPRGFTDGINLFNAGSVETIRQRTQRVLDRAKALVASSGGKMRFERAVTRALDETTDAALSAASPGSARDSHKGLFRLPWSSSRSRGIFGQVEVVDPASHADTSDEAIADQLNGSAGITAEQLDAVLAKVREIDRELLREMLAQQAEVFSPRRVSNELLALHQRHMQLAAQHHVQPEDVYYFIYLPEKSYGMVAMAHRQATGTRVDRYLSGYRELKDRRLGPNTMLVILDDVAGSGDRLGSARAEVGRAYSGPVVASPMISTMQAQQLFDGRGGISHFQPNTVYMPQKLMSGLEASPLMQGLPRAVGRRIRELLGSLGYARNGTSVAFPYMAPDNNNLWFADQLAKEFIVNKSRKGAKADGTWQPPP